MPNPHNAVSEDGVYVAVIVIRMRQAYKRAPGLVALRGNVTMDVHV